MAVVSVIVHSGYKTSLAVWNAQLILMRSGKTTMDRMLEGITERLSGYGEFTTWYES